MMGHWERVITDPLTGDLTNVPWNVDTIAMKLMPDGVYWKPAPSPTLTPHDRALLGMSYGGSE